ncbi:uncharacterized protein JCM6883_004051 [Sporobolomyces salmoneus]|uniref:uncharacterized protein n=1 Tax=Sporobolomyces salmoneus TaxID=183962 RepID=UPI00316B033F
MDQLPPPRISLLVHSPAPSTLVPVLQQLLEPSPPLTSLLAPQLHEHLSYLPSNQKPTSYAQLLDICANLVEKWDTLDQAEFVGSHPRIGEVHGLSKASESEQGTTSGQEPTSGHVLRRLTMLNAFYEETFPNLRFITFVNGRSRAEIVPELESILGLNLPPPSQDQGEIRFTELKKKVKIQPLGSGPWRKELQRDLGDMWKIAKSRLSKLGVE